MLRYTGHPFVDVGVATIVEFSRKQRPEDIVLGDLDNVAAYLRDIYCYLKPMQNHISTIFQGPAFTQPAKTLDDRLAYADLVLFRFKDDSPVIDGVNCVFFPEKPATIYAFRQHIPLLNGRGIANFSGLGSSGIPVSGIALLAIHAMPLGCLKCGNLLAFHQLYTPNDSNGGHMNLALVRRALAANRKAISMMSPDSSEGSLPNFGSYAKTRYVDEILRARRQTQQRFANINNINGYYFTNYGPKPNLEIIRLDNAVLDFIDVVQQDFSEAWNRVVYFGWQRPKDEESATIDDENTVTWRNRVYEQLFNLPDKAREFIFQLAKGQNWQLIEIFLERVMYMDRERIDTYRELGDRLAHYILEYENGSPGFYYRFSRAEKDWKLRNIIKSAAERMLKARTQEPLFTYDEFILAFEHPSDTYNQWRLARDLISIRMLEILHKNQQRVDIAELPDEIELDEEE